MRLQRKFIIRARTTLTGIRWEKPRGLSQALATRGVVYSAREAHNLTGQAQLLAPQQDLGSQLRAYFI